MSTTFKPTVCIVGGDNTKLCKYIPNMRETATSNAAVIKLVIKAENKDAGWSPSSAWFPIKGTGYGLWKGFPYRQQTSSATQALRQAHSSFANYTVQGRREKRSSVLQIA